MLHSVRIALIHWVTFPNSTRPNNYTWLWGLCESFTRLVVYTLQWHISNNTLFMHPDLPPPFPKTSLPHFAYPLFLISPEYLLYQEKLKTMLMQILWGANQGMLWKMCTGEWMHSKRITITREYANWGYQIAGRWRSCSSDNSAKRPWQQNLLTTGG